MKMRKTIRPLILASLALIFAAMHAGAAYVLTLQQTAGNVVATGSGSFNLAALTLNENGSTGFAANLFPSFAQVILGVESPDVDAYTGISGPGSIGSGGSIEFANSASGDFTGVDDDLYLFVPHGYTSGAQLSGTATSCVRQVLQNGHGLGGRRFAVAAERRRSRSVAVTAKLRG